MIPDGTFTVLPCQFVVQHEMSYGGHICDKESEWLVVTLTGLQIPCCEKHMPAFIGNKYRIGRA